MRSMNSSPTPGASIAFINRIGGIYRIDLNTEKPTFALCGPDTAIEAVNLLGGTSESNERLRCILAN